MIVYDGSRMLGQTATVVLEYRNGRVAVMDNMDTGGLRVLTNKMLDWAEISNLNTDEEDTLA